ncbi:hypothetical protein GCM10027277_33420 [Pseudoduganella ginsengisoli]|uniref:PEP-CTERM sorting domain-containing protein n=1 Tax=Pseudoduganella ginsengisoli TaxID=1462440 RepID=A0A6L6Q6C3_9BURK|nr:PEP-CTERM sorting domain-containing protein [Pseudoduganella ginsengisoli]MTW05327.1 PEP-CTERM sorting domain-containing protein [Pseudoduganella ginsengisoli]
MKHYSLLLLGLLSALPATAEVIYRWHTVTPSAELPGFDAVLRITDDAYWRGSAFLDYSGCAGVACAMTAIDAGIVYMGYSFAQGSDGHRPPLAAGVYDKFDLQFDRVGGVAGSLSYNTTEVELAMSGQALWTVDLLRGDPYIGTQCGGPGYCSGVTGYFLAERLPVQIPEPHTAGLLLAGLAGWLAARRKVSSAILPAQPVLAAAPGSAQYLPEQSHVPA